MVDSFLIKTKAKNNKNDQNSWKTRESYPDHYFVCYPGNVTEKKNHFRCICVENLVMAFKVKFNGCLSWFIFSYWSELAEWVEA